MIDMAYLGAQILIYLAQEAQMVLLFAKKVNIPEEYADFSIVFSKKSLAVLPKCSNINKYAINLEPGKQLY